MAAGLGRLDSAGKIAQVGSANGVKTAETHFEHNESALRLIADMEADVPSVRLRAMCGRLRVGKKNLHLAALVGAAMCSAFVRGTHDRWP
jgi:hypothetical protein